MNYYLYNSTNPNKKYMVKFWNEYTGRKNTIHFGNFAYDDYTITNNDERKRLYKLRHAGDMINDLSYAGAWSMHVLWNKKTLEESIKDMEKRFKITIINHM